MNTYRLSSRALALRSSDVRDLLRHAHAPGIISMAGGLPASTLFDIEGVRLATEHVLRHVPEDALQYGMTEGQPRLRQALRARSEAAGISMTGRELIVTSGSQQALDLMARLLVNEGDVVIVERPTYLAALQAFGLCGAKFRTLPVDGEGGCMKELLGLPRGDTPKLVYLVSNFGNPSSMTWRTERRLQLLRWATDNEVFVIEDDPYGALRTEGSALPGLLALTDRVPGSARWCGMTSTLSKTVAPGLRVGWLLLPAELAGAASKVKQAVDLHTSSFTQEVAAAYLGSGRLEPHLDTVRSEYALRRRALAAALRRSFGSALEFEEPKGGMFIWARLTDGTDARALLPEALRAGAVYVPGDAFYVSDPDRSSLRLSFTAHPPEKLVEGARRLALAHAVFNRDWREPDLARAIAADRA
ncbi:PLP-dependent aminotransferase family protein [soil metagenome]